MDHTLEYFHSNYMDMIFRICLKYSKSIEQAEDLCQDILIQLPEKISGFKGASSLRTWVYRVSINFCLDHLRWEKRQNNLNQSFLEEIVSKSFIHKDDTALGKVALEVLISKFDDKTAKLLLLELFEGFSHQEIADSMDMKKSTVTKKLKNAHIKMELKLERADFYISSFIYLALLKIVYANSLLDASNL